jgi:hypothetical protein
MSSDATPGVTNLRRAVTGAGRVFAADFVVPGPEEPHFFEAL